MLPHQTLNQTFEHVLTNQLPGAIFLQERLLSKLKISLERSLQQNDQDPGTAFEGLLNTDLLSIQGQNIQDWMQAWLSPHIEANPDWQGPLSRYAERLPSQTVAEYFHFQTPIRNHPWLRKESRQSLMYRLLEFSSLQEESTMQALAEKLGERKYLTPGFWEESAEEFSLNHEQTESIKNWYALSYVTHQNLPLLEAFKERNIQELKQLAAYRREDYLPLIDDSYLPKDLATPEAFAEHLEKKVERQYPILSLAHRMVIPESRQLEMDIQKSRTFFRDNPNLRFNRPFEEQEVIWPSDITAEEQQEVLQAATSIRVTRNRYKPLAKPILADVEKSPADKAQLLVEQIGAYQSLLLQNETIDLQSINLFDSENLTQLNLEQIPENLQPGVIDQLRVDQRLERLTHDIDLSNSLAREGINSSYELNQLSTQSFTNLSNRLNLSPEIRNDLVQSAGGIVTQTNHQLQNLLDFHSPYYSSLLSNNVQADIVEYYSQLPNYQELFGTRSYCDCEHCRSIYSPAAYFVDLMRFVEDFEEQNPNIPKGMALKGRRLGLWSIPLDCEHTNEEVPYLNIVNNVLQNNLHSAINDDPNLEGTPIRVLAESVFPFQLPYNVHLHKLRLYVEHFDIHTYDLIELFEPEDLLLMASERLGLSMEERSIWTDDRLMDSVLAPYFGFGPGKDMSRAAQFGGLLSVRKFLNRTGLTRAELNDLLFQGLSGIPDRDGNSDPDTEIGQGLSQKFYINQVGLDHRGLPLTSPMSVYVHVDQEEFEYLHQSRLSRMMRLIRISRKLGWNFADTDLILRRIDKSQTEDIDNTTIVQLSIVHQLATHWEIPIDELTALWSDLKTTGWGTDEGPLFNRLFDREDDSISFDLDSSATNQDLSDPENTYRLPLLSALSISDEAFTHILESAYLEADPTDLTLDLATLSKLYRLSKLPKLMRLSQEAFFLLLELLDIQKIESLLNLRRLSLVQDWLQETGFSVYELHYLATGIPNNYANVEPDPGTVGDLLLTLQVFIHSGIDSLVNQLIAFFELSESEFQTRVQNTGLVQGFEDLREYLRLMLTTEVESIPPEVIPEEIPEFLNAVAYVEVPPTSIAELILRWQRSYPDLTTLQPQDYKNLRHQLADFLGLGYQEFVLRLPVTGTINTEEDLDDLIDQMLGTPTEPGAPFISPGDIPEDIQQLFTIPAEVTMSSEVIADWILLIQEEYPDPGILVDADYGIITRKIGQVLGISRQEFEERIMDSDLVEDLGDMQSLINDMLIIPTQDGDPILPVGNIPADVLTFFNTMANPGFEEDVMKDLMLDLQAQMTAHLEGIQEQVAIFYGINTSKLKLLIDATGQINGPGDVAALIKLVLTGLTLDEEENSIAEEDIPSELLGLFNKIAFYNYRSEVFSISESGLAFLNEHPDLFFKETATLWDRLERLYLYQQLNEEYPEAEESFQEVLIEDWYNPVTAEKLAEATGWEVDQMSKLHLHHRSFDTPPFVVQAPFYTIRRLHWMHRCFEITDTMQIHISTLLELAKLKADAGPAQIGQLATVAKDIFEAKYEAEELEEKARPIEDQLLEAKRDAQANFLLWYNDFPEETGKTTDFDALYRYLLIDVSYSSCADISPIKEGLLALQTYVQRCLMNLEPGIDPNTINAQQWEWMKNYRVWEANRKVFLYPETYIEPELRTSKSPEFQELEDELLQVDITDENVEPIFESYLEKLNVLARLRIAGNCHHKETETLYLFGRDTSAPNDYYFRTLIGETSWTPWKRVEFRIPSEKVSPIIAWNRLFLFWTERDLDVDENEDIAVTVNYSYLEKDGRWAPPQTLLETNYDDEERTHASWNRCYPVFDSIENKIRIDYDIYFDNEDNNTFGLTRPFGNYPFELLNSNLLTEKNSEGISFDLHPWTPYAYFGKLNSISEEAAPEVAISSSIIYYSKNILKILIEDDVIDNFSRETVLSSVPLYVSEVELINGLDNHFFFLEEKDQFLIKRIPPDTNAQLQTEGTFHFDRITSSIPFEFTSILFEGGINELLAVENQGLDEHDFDLLSPEPLVVGLPSEKADFNGAFGIYFWELFFHIPFLIANTLNQNQKFEEAQKWYHYIFNPMALPESGQLNPYDHHWNFLPFRNQSIESLEEMLTNPDALFIYKNDPFKPHEIARLRQSSYPKAIVMKYIDNLLDWGDQLFERDTWESIAEATILYVTAQQILGPRPIKGVPCENESPATYKQLKNNSLDWEGNEFLYALENTPAAAVSYSGTIPITESSIPYYFCIPENETFLAYWDRVEDRLFKIRSCMNIEGVVRQLSLWEPPIDPMLLVRAVASGQDLSAAIADLYAPLPIYRFRFLLERARQFISTVQQFGNALQGALDKKDAEALGLLRSVHEQTILDLMTQNRKDQIEEAEVSKSGLEENLERVKLRQGHFMSLILQGLISNETKQLNKLNMVNVSESTSKILASASAIAYFIQDKIVKPDGKKDKKRGGYKWGRVLEAGSSISALGASIYGTEANRNSIKAGHDRRSEDWGFQKDQAQKEIDQIEKQIEAADFRIKILEQEQNIHLKQIEQAGAIYYFLKDKFTDEELYNWMIGQLSSLYFQVYNMAYELARSAQTALNFELDREANYIQYGHWDSLKKGLLSGERLMIQLMQLEKEYYEKNERRYELVKHISLRRLNPLALLQLKINGECEIDIPEWLFDLDTPSHYLRRIKRVSLSIPAVAGPYTNINCTLSLLKGSIRKTALLKNGAYERDLEQDDDRFSDYYGAIQSIVTSSGQNDSGMFEQNLEAERYLKFEGVGGVSSWKLKLPQAFPQFDYNTITDVIIHMQYTAKEGGSALGEAAEISLGKILRAGVDQEKVLFQLFSLQHDFPNEWHRLRTEEAANITINLKNEHFHYLAQYLNIDRNQLKVDLYNPELDRISEYDIAEENSSPALVKIYFESWSIASYESDYLTDEDNVFMIISYAAG